MAVFVVEGGEWLIMSVRQGAYLTSRWTSKSVCLPPFCESCDTGRHESKHALDVQYARRQGLGTTVEDLACDAIKCVICIA